ncbi:hypothetical protein LJC68_02405 [Bacteroidales bacterium OttesenSCG-928-B11]|nr:hypothetical protein [Bacteroidales bacterium OttesenSCG-928-B11]MDL2325907.1 hypothetical protein [Bacteroidales bacterium OttesenSCG-928-A14]
MLQHIFRCLIIVAAGLLIVYFAEIDNKFPVMIGWTVGAVLAFIVGNIMLRYTKKKNGTQDTKRKP